MRRRRSWFRDHSLSLSTIVAGLLVTGLGMRYLEEGRWLDLCLAIGPGFLLFGALGIAQGPLREINRPEK